MTDRFDPRIEDLRRRLHKGSGKLTPAAARLARATFTTPT